MCSGLLTSSAKGASADLASAARDAWTSSRTLESLCTISAFSGSPATCLSLGRPLIPAGGLCRSSVPLGQEIPSVPQGAPECRFRGCRHYQVLFPSPHAVLAGSGVVGDQRGERRIGALDQEGQSPVVDLRGPLGDIIEQTNHCFGDCRTATRRQKFADFLHLPARLDGREQLAGLQTPDKVRNGDSVRIQGQAVALLEIQTGRRNLQVRQHAKNGLYLHWRRLVGGFH